MAGVMIFHPMDLVFGVLGVVLTFFVYLAPVPIFYKIHKRKATEGFQAFPYIISLLNCMLWVYYSLLAWDIYLLTINTVGCLLRMLFIAVHTVYAPRGVRITTAKLVVLLNVVLYALILLLTLLLAEGSKRVHILGWICVVSGISVFAAPLSILRQVLQTRSVEYMPFGLSLFLTLSAAVWSAYGVLQGDAYVIIPSVLGVLLGLAQIALYVAFREAST